MTYLGCPECIHLTKQGKCPAFKNGAIPLEIKSGAVQHTEILAGQVKQIVYELKAE